MISRKRQIAWILKYLPDAIAAGQKYTVPANVPLGIGAHESGWSTSPLAREHNNLHGIKARVGFRHFSTPRESFFECARLLGVSPQFASAREKIFAYEDEGHPSWEVERYWFSAIGAMYLKGRNMKEISNAKERAEVERWIESTTTIHRRILEARKLVI
jgi:hypothetical protein